MSSNEVVAAVIITAADGKVDEVIAAFATCIEKTHQEEGCLTYALHRDNSEPNRLVHIERWRSQSDLDAHMQQPYVAELFSVVGKPGVLAEAPALHFSTPLGLGSPTKGTLGG